MDHWGYLLRFRMSLTNKHIHTQIHTDAMFIYSSLSPPTPCDTKGLREGPPTSSIPCLVHHIRPHLSSFPLHSSYPRRSRSSSSSCSGGCPLDSPSYNSPISRMQSVPSHLHRFAIRYSSTYATPDASRTSSFGTWSCHRTPIILLSALFSNTLTHLDIVSLSYQFFHPYSIYMVDRSIS